MVQKSLDISCFQKKISPSHFLRISKCSARFKNLHIVASQFVTHQPLTWKPRWSSTLSFRTLSWRRLEEGSILPAAIQSVYFLPVTKDRTAWINFSFAFNVSVMFPKKVQFAQISLGRIPVKTSNTTGRMYQNTWTEGRFCW